MFECSCVIPRFQPSAMSFQAALREINPRAQNGVAGKAAAYRLRIGRRATAAGSGVRASGGMRSWTRSSGPYGGQVT